MVIRYSSVFIVKRRIYECFVDHKIGNYNDNVNGDDNDDGDEGNDGDDGDHGDDGGDSDCRKKGDKNEHKSDVFYHVN